MPMPQGFKDRLYPHLDARPHVHRRHNHPTPHTYPAYLPYRPR